jgi:type I restriction enzyme S subunit
MSATNGHVLGDVASFVRGITFTPEDLKPPFEEGTAVCMRTKNVQVDLDEKDLIAVPKEFVRRKEQYLAEGDLLVSSANSWNLVGKCCWVPKLDYEATAGGFISILRADRKKVDPRYLYHWFAAPQTQHEVRLCGRQTTNISNLNYERCLNLPVPLPKLDEQKRIAAILDKADAIRRNRQEGASLSQSLRRAVFCDFFGDLKSNPNRWATKTLGDICHGRLRNGVSPSSAGKYVGSVLVLSAITGDRFDASCVKEGTFASPFTETQLVNENDFLICRGNGNVELVARAAFPTAAIEHCVFPDTMIAATVDTNVIEKEYLEEVWRTAFVRQQVESGARTTNGTHKVNQGVLEKVAFPIPPLSLQKKFAAISRNCETVREKFSDHVDSDLFNALVQRAFKGEL